MFKMDQGPRNLSVSFSLGKKETVEPIIKMQNINQKMYEKYTIIYFGLRNTS